MTYLTALTLFHTGLSLVAIGAGAGAMVDLFHGGRFRSWTNLFLVTAILTSLTGFFFPFNGVTPAQIIGVLALLVLAVVLLAYYKFNVARMWRWIYAVSMVASLYLLVFVGVVQAFQKIGFLHRLAPTGVELPFLLAQTVTFVFFAVLGIVTAFRYRPEVASARFG